MLQKNHPLESAWEFWIHKPLSAAAGNGSDEDAYNSSLLKLQMFKTIEDFWSQLEHIVLPSTLGNIALTTPENVKVKGLSLFRSDIGPKWEHEKNKGFKIVLKTNSSICVDDLWYEIIYALVGETIPYSEFISGLRFTFIVDKRKCLVSRLELWSNIIDGQLLKEIEEYISKNLSYDPSQITCVSYAHQK